jgi:branched-chain amino acid transport system ATP-binding protein
LARDDILRPVFVPDAASAFGVHASVTPVPLATDGKVLTVKGLTKSFGGITAVDRVSFELHRGQILGVIGPNGAGKTTVIDLLSGVLPADEGSIWFNDRDITAWRPHHRTMAGLGRSFQDARLFPKLTVAENLAIGLERHLEHRDHLAALCDLPAVRHEEADVAFTVEALIELMNLGAFKDKFVSELSTGSRRIVDLTMALAHNPSVMLLDEPSSGIAQREVEALGPLLQRLRDQTGCALLVIEHDMPFITSLADELIALHLGAVVSQGPPADVLDDPVVVGFYLGDHHVPVAGSVGP